MSLLKSNYRVFIFIFILCLVIPAQAVAENSEVDRLVAAMLKETPVIDNLRQLCDEIGGRAEIIEPLKRALKPVEALGPFQYINIPLLGTDHYDFMVQGIANVMIDQDPAGYAHDYHAESDTFDKVDIRQLKLNAAVMAAYTYGFATMKITWKRQSRAEIIAPAVEIFFHLC
ncbi:MAG: M28 family peptidase [bacterium]|nr:M28 family peptidase [bacterium]